MMFKYYGIICLFSILVSLLWKSMCKYQNIVLKEKGNSAKENKENIFLIYTILLLANLPFSKNGGNNWSINGVCGTVVPF